MKRSGSFIVPLILSLFVVFSFSSRARGEAASEGQSSSPVAEVNQVPIGTAAVEEALRVYLRQIGHRELSSSRMTALRKEIVGNLIEEELLYQEGLKKGWVVGKDEIEAESIRLRNRFPSQEAFEAALAKEKLTPEKIEAGLRRFILIRKVWDSISSMTEEEKKIWLKEIRENSEVKIY